MRGVPRLSDSIGHIAFIINDKKVVVDRNVIYLTQNFIKLPCVIAKIPYDTVHKYVKD